MTNLLGTLDDIPNVKRAIKSSPVSINSLCKAMIVLVDIQRYKTYQ